MDSMTFHIQICGVSRSSLKLGRQSFVATIRSNVDGQIIPKHCTPDEEHAVECDQSVEWNCVLLVPS